MSPTLTQRDYIDVLRRFHRIVAAWDGWADAHVPADLRDLLHGRRRAGLLADDLQVMGVSAPIAADDLPAQRMAQVPAGDPRSVFLGRMYVMEGSTLGGQFIARHVEEVLGLVRGQGNSYFAGYGDATGQRWREFKAVLAALPDSETETVIHSAKNLFDIFGETMRDSLPPIPIPGFAARPEAPVARRAAAR